MLYHNAVHSSKHVAIFADVLIGCVSERSLRYLLDTRLYELRNYCLINLSKPTTLKNRQDSILSSSIQCYCHFDTLYTHYTLATHRRGVQRSMRPGPGEGQLTFLALVSHWPVTAALPLLIGQELSESTPPAKMLHRDRCPASRSYRSCCRNLENDPDAD